MLWSADVTAHLHRKTRRATAACWLSTLSGACIRKGEAVVMTDADYIWGGLLLAGAAVEAWALWTAKPGGTLSESTRRWFRVNTRAGATLFGLGWASFSVWFLFHIVG
jgi:hypothetical protein